MNLNLKEIKNDYDITIHRVNKSILGQIPKKWGETILRTIDGVDEISFSVPKYLPDRITLDKVRNPLYDDIKNERFVCVNNDSYFVIKEITEDEFKNKQVKAYSREIKLGKIDINIEDMGLQLFTTDLEKGIISLNDYMEEQIGWSLGHVDDSIAYRYDDEGNKSEKLRWQESINSNWHDFLITNIKEQFECIVIFDTFNKKVNLYHIDSFGDNTQLMLSEDNYIKTISSTDSSQDIVTRMKLIGNEEMNIIGATCTGYDYIENYSYFMDNREMSDELIYAIKEYEKMIDIREPIWKELVSKKNEVSLQLLNKKNEFSMLMAEINALKSMKKAYSLNKDVENEAIVSAQLTEKNDLKVIMDIEIQELEKELKDLMDAITNINILCKRETCTNEDGDLVFNKELLEELKEFLYYETYTNDAFLNVDDLISTGKRELTLKCIPTTEWSLTVANFMGRLIDNGMRQHWNGNLGLGDVIILYNKDEDKEYPIYFVGYTQNIKDGGLTLELSNKKSKVDNSKVIADYLNQAEKAMKSISLKRYLFVQQKYNRINLDYVKK